MKTVKVQQSILVEATGIEYKKGQEVEVSEELAKRHIKTGIFKEVVAKAPKPKAAAKPKDDPKPKQDVPEPTSEAPQVLEVK